MSSLGAPESRIAALRHGDRWRAAWRRATPLTLSLFAAALLLFAHGATMVRADTPPNGITVNGSGTAELPPDEAKVSGSVQTEAATSADALNQNSTTLQAVIAAAQGLGFASSDITTQGLSIYPVFSQTNASSNGGVTPPPTVVGYRATNGITVTVKDLTQVGGLIQTMVGAGINEFNGVSYQLQNPEQLRVTALQTAIGDAQAQAQAAAASMGVQLGGILNFTEQSTSAPVPRVAAQATFVGTSVAAPAPPPPVQPGPLSGTANVTITYAILGQ